MSAAWNWTQEITRLTQNNISFSLVTVCGVQGASPRDLGAKLIVVSANQIYGTIGGGRLEQLAIEAACKGLSTRRAEAEPLTVVLGPEAGQCCGGKVSLLIEYIGHLPRLFIFGAGHVGQRLARLADGLPFDGVLIDERPEWMNQAPTSIAKALTDPVGFAQSLLPRRDDAVVILTHSHELDQKILQTLLEAEIATEQTFGFLGLIGSLTKWRKFRARLLDFNIPETSLTRVRCPVGLNIGGKSPQEVAISIAAELIQDYHNRTQKLVTSSAQDIMLHP